MVEIFSASGASPLTPWRTPFSEGSRFVLTMTSLPGSTLVITKCLWSLLTDSSVANLCHAHYMYIKIALYSAAYNVLFSFLGYGELVLSKIMLW
jgi:hypothetical protein